MAGTEPIPVRFRNTGWGTLRRPFALVSIENVVIVTESCEMTVVIDLDPLLEVGFCPQSPVKLSYKSKRHLLGAGP